MSWYGDGPPSWYVKHRYHAPQRGRVRQMDVEVRAEYHGNGDLEDNEDFDNVKPRNSAKWDWW
jgi:hypothetical protein